MCTIIALYRVVDSWPVVIAANRDEFYRRPAVAPQELEAGLWAGVDQRAGGTWMGATNKGLFAGLTNQRTYRPSDDTRRSRGEVVLGVLRTQSLAGADHYLSLLHAADFNPFNLLYGTADELKIAYSRPTDRAIDIERVAPGIHVLANDRLDSPAFPKIARTVAHLTGEIEPTATWPSLVRTLTSALANHDTAPIEQIPEPPAKGLFNRQVAQQLDAVCIHTPSYGTCSATLLAVDRNGLCHYEFAHGPPCRTRFERVWPAS